MKLTINSTVLNSVLDKMWGHVVSPDDPHIGERWVIKFAGETRVLS